MKDSLIDYAKLIDEAMHHVVKSVLCDIKVNGLPGDHHFFITFRTDAPGVMISEDLKGKYPEEMTIVIQHQFYDLEIEEDYFSIVLSFEHVKQNLTIPFSSMISFVDPSVKFGLQFNTLELEEFDEEDEELEITIELENENSNDDPEKTKSKKGAAKKKKGDSTSNVITLDSFRKKKGGSDG